MGKHNYKRKTCLAGHWAPIYKFGVDRSKPDGLNPYCKECVNDRVAGARKAAQEKEESRLRELGLEKPDKPELTASERAIQRERAKRQREKEIEESLMSEPENTEFEHPLPLALTTLRKGKGRTVGWSCPVGSNSR